MDSESADPSRRRLLKGAVALSASLLIPLARSTGQVVNGAGPPPRPQPASPQPWTSHQVAAGGTSMEYFEFGNPKGVPLVLIHGFPDSPIAWQGVLARLDLDRFRVVLPCLRGYGKSTVTNDSALTGQQAALSLDIIGLLDALNIDRCHLAGHDWGAKTAYGVAVLAPERLLTLTTLATAYEFWRGGLYPPAQVHGNWYQFYFQTKEAQIMLQKQPADFCEELWRTWSPTWPFSQDEFLAAASAWANPQFASIVLSYYRLRWGGDASFSPALTKWQSRLDAKPKPAIKTPTTFVQGAADACDLVNGADGQEPFFTAGYKRIILPDVGHFPHRENPARVAQAIIAQVDAWEKG